MAANSKIEWTDATWNPLAGCTRASAGCDNCYAAKMSLRLEAMALADIEAGKDPGGKRKYIGIAAKNGKGVPAFNGKINLDWDELQRPYSWRKPRRVFVNSMSDLFHKDVPDGFILDAFNVMRDNPQHTFQVLTKRPDRAMYWSGKAWGKLPDNVWIGTSIENQETADDRIPYLVGIRAVTRFLSCEPLLGPVNLRPWLHSMGAPTKKIVNGRSVPSVFIPFHWVIVGGESGPHARPMHPDWARSLRDQCIAAGVAFHFKQWGKTLPFEQEESYNSGWMNKEYPVSDIGWIVGKKAAGRLLDGREWNQFPEAR